MSANPPRGFDYVFSPPFTLFCRLRNSLRQDMATSRRARLLDSGSGPARIGMESMNAVLGARNSDVILPASPPGVADGLCVHENTPYSNNEQQPEYVQQG